MDKIGTGTCILFTNKHVKLLLYLLLFAIIFPIFSLDKTDPLGFETLSTFAISKLIRLFWIAIIILLNFLIVFSAGQMGLYKKVKPNYVDMLLILYCVTAFFSIAYKTPGSVVAWYRAIELFIISFSILHFTKLFDRVIHGKNFIDVMSSLLLKILMIIIFLFIILSIVSPDLLFVSEIQDRKRLGGYVYSPNFLASLLTIISIANYNINAKKNRYIYFSLFSIIIFLMTILTGSRTGLMTLILASAILVYVHISCKYEKHGLYLRNILITALMSIVVIITVFMYSGSEKLLIFLADHIGIGKDPLAELLTLNNRVSIYITAFDGLAKNTLFGVGYVDGVRSYLADNYELSFWLPPHVHNGIFEVLLAQGIIGGLPILIIIICSVQKATKSLLKPQLYTKEVLLLSVVIIIIILISLTTVPFGNIVNSMGVIFFLSCIKLLESDMKKLTKH